MNKKRNYYLKNADQFGWGPKTAKLNPERVGLLEKYVVGEKVLDIGCGTGIYVDYLAKKGKKATGVDFVKEFIDYAKKHYQGEFLVANAYKLPFKDKLFDTVIMFDILEHLENEEKALKEAQRVGRERIILIVPRKTDEILKAHGLIFQHHIDSTHLRYYTKKRLKALARKTKISTLELKKIRPVSIKSFFLHQITGPFWLKKILAKIIFTFFQPANFWLEIALIGEIK